MSTRPSAHFNNPNPALKQQILVGCPDFPDTTLNNLQRNLFANDIFTMMDDYYWGDKNKTRYNPHIYGALNAIRTHAIFRDYEPSSDKLIEDLSAIPEDQRNIVIEVARNFKDASLKCVFPIEGEPIDKEFIANKFLYQNNRRSEGKVGTLWHVIRKAAIYDAFKSHILSEGKTISSVEENDIERMIVNYDRKDHDLQGALASIYNFCIPKGYTEEQIEKRHEGLEQELLKKVMISIDYINATDSIENKNMRERMSILRYARSAALEQCPEGSAIRVLTDEYRLEHTVLESFVERGIKPYTARCTNGDANATNEAAQNVASCE